MEKCERCSRILHILQALAVDLELYEMKILDKEEFLLKMDSIKDKIDMEVRHG